MSEKIKVGFRTLRYVKRHIPHETLACYDNVLQIYTLSGYKDVDTEDLIGKSQWETPEQEENYEAAKLRVRETETERWVSHMDLDSDEL
jgi:hypothetical protein